MAGQFVLRVFDVEHGACAMMEPPSRERIAMIDCGHNDSTGWRPSTFIRHHLRRTALDYLFITNTDQDHVSDLEGLWTSGIVVRTLHRNWSPDAATLRRIKEDEGGLTNDMERYLQIHAQYTGPVAAPFNGGMGGATCSTFCNLYPTFSDTNNLSLVVFIRYAGFQILFPGDLEAAGWKELLRNSAFVQELQSTHVLVASHHGRQSGFCSEVFDYVTPKVVVISDKSIIYGTQETVPDYRSVVAEDGVIVSNQTRRRQVLTTRRDGDITFSINTDGSFSIATSKVPV